MRNLVKRAIDKSCIDVVEFYTPIIICILYCIDPADICGRSGRFVNPIICVCTYIYTFDIRVRSR